MGGTERWWKGGPEGGGSERREGQRKEEGGRREREEGRRKGKGREELGLLNFREELMTVSPFFSCLPNIPCD